MREYVNWQLLTSGVSAGDQRVVHPGCYGVSGHYAEVDGWKNTLFYCWRSSTVEQLICNQQVVGSSPIASFLLNSKVSQYGAERCPSGQREQTVNLPAYAFEGSNPSLSTLHR